MTDADIRSGNEWRASVAIIGAGLAGSEAALVLARMGFKVELFEARPQKMTPAHKTAFPAELICSNSFKSQDLPSSHGLLKTELNMLGSPLLDAARKCSVPAGNALAVDRELFGSSVENLLTHDPCIKLIRRELTEPPSEPSICIIAAGPLAADSLTQWLKGRFQSSSLHFYDAIAPIVSCESIDRSIVFSASRWEDGEGDYLNCPFTKEEYIHFYDELKRADLVNIREFENRSFFEACLPVEVVAQRGFEALAFGTMKPVGLRDPRNGSRPFAVCQLRKETAAAESYNMVGFQTRLTITEQRRVFRLIPGLENAEFLRWGSIHRNTYLDSPKLLAEDLSFREESGLFLAGQICGNEGYTESIATGHLVALSVAARLKGVPFVCPPVETALGALLRHVTLSTDTPFTPSNVHFGLFPPLELQNRKGKIGKKEKKGLLCERAIEKMEKWKSVLG